MSITALAITFVETPAVETTIVAMVGATTAEIIAVTTVEAIAEATFEEAILIRPITIIELWDVRPRRADDQVMNPAFMNLVTSYCCILFII